MIFIIAYRIGLSACLCLLRTHLIPRQFLPLLNALLRAETCNSGPSPSDGSEVFRSSPLAPIFLIFWPVLSFRATLLFTFDDYLHIISVLLTTIVAIYQGMYL